MNIEWIDQMVSDVVGVVGELYILSIRVVYNDAWIGMIGDTFLTAAISAVCIYSSIRIIKWKVTPDGILGGLDAEDKRTLQMLIVIMSAVILIFLYPIYITAITEYVKVLTTPEWYALERIERLVK